MSDKIINFFPRINYSVFVLQIPQLRGKELRLAVCYKLKMLYPGDLNDFEIIIKKNGKLKESYLVFVVPKDLPKKPIPISTLLLQQALKKKTATAFYIDNSFIEIVKIEQGAISESIVKGVKNISDICSYIKTYCAKEISVEIFCDNNLRDLVHNLKTVLNNENIIFRDIAGAIKKISFDSICLYNQYSSRRKYEKIGFAVFAFIVIFLTANGLYQYKIITEEKNWQQKEEQIYIERRLQRELAQKEKLSNLELEYVNLIERKRLKPFEILGVISSCLDRSVLVLSLTIRENNFQIEALANDSLGILRNFEENNQISNLKMNQIRPEQNRERFSMNGTVLPAKHYVSEDYIIEEKIKIFEVLVQKERSQRAADRLTASIFGMSVRDILRRNNCFIKSYQYLGYGNEREIEFSIQGSSRNFFNFLSLASMPSYNWDFSLVQVRNLFPRDVLDIVIRIRGDFGADNSCSKTVFENEITIIEKGVVEIARNYFVAPQRAAIRQNESAPARAPERPGKELVTWLSFVGIVGEVDGGNYVYMKNARDNRMLKFKVDGTGDMSCRILDSGNIEVIFGNRMYEVQRVR